MTSTTSSTTWLNHPILRPSKSEREKSSSLAPPKSPSNNSRLKTGLKTILLIVHGQKIKAKKGRRELQIVRDEAKKYSIDCLIEKETSCEGDCINIVRDYVSGGTPTKPDAIFVLGGDGTLREAVQGYVEGRKIKPLMENEKHVPIMALPCGTGNNFARDLKCFSIQDCFRLACEKGEARDMDAVEIESLDKDKKKTKTTMSINVVTWGLIRDAAETAEKMRFLGPIRYDLAGFYQILKNKSNVASLTVETPSSQMKGSCTNEEFLMLCAQNTRCCGRGFHFTPLAKLDDGLIDIVVAKKCGLMKTVALFDDLKAPKNGAHVEKDDVFYIQCKSLKIDTGDREGLVGVDGEVTLKTPVKLNCLRGAFCTFV